MFYNLLGHAERVDSEGAAVLEPVDSAVSNTAVREDVWVRIPPAAPISWSQFECRATPPDASACADVRELGAAYTYLLGLYLGDGCVSRMPKNVWRIRISLDSRYPDIVRSCASAIQTVVGRRAGSVRRPTWLEVYNGWKHWPCLIPQTGPGLKHERRIELETWQGRLAKAYPRMLLRGLIHSDGCRAINRITHVRGGESVRYEYVRYFFSNRSPEIRQIFLDACHQVGVQARLNNWFSISVARRESVAILESFIGAKS